MKKSLIPIALLSAVLASSCGLFGPKAETPTISPAAGTYPPGIVIARFATATAGASIYYTTDGSAPTEKSTLYTDAGISVTANATIRARAFAEGYRGSDESSTDYVISDLGNTVSGTIVAAGSEYPKTVAASLGGSDAYLGALFPMQGSYPTATVGQGIPGPAFLFYHDPVTGAYALTGLPADQGFCLDLVLKKTGSQDAYPLPGNYLLRASSFNGIPLSDLSVSRSGVKLHAVKILHVTSPVDNAAPHIGGTTAAPVPIASPVTFSWEAVPGATSYMYTVTEWNGDWTRVRDIAYDVETTATSVEIAITPVDAGNYFNFYVSAWNDDYVPETPSDWWGAFQANSCFTESASSTYPMNHLIFKIQ